MKLFEMKLFIAIEDEIEDNEVNNSIKGITNYLFDDVLNLNIFEVGHNIVQKIIIDYPNVNNDENDEEKYDKECENWINKAREEIKRLE